MLEQRNLSRRDFFRAGAAGTALLLGNPLPCWAASARLPQRELGRTGVQVPILGLGTVAVGNVFDEKAALRLLHKAIDLGVTYIDTAPAGTRIAPVTGYGRAQRYLNGVLRERRKEVFLVTKCLETDGERALTTLRANLKELGVERVDLTYTHSIGHALYDFDQLVGAITKGELPASALPGVSFLKAPGYEDGHAGYSDPLDEQAGTVTLINFLQQQSGWKDTAVIVAFDESGGWWDHVAPPDLGGVFASYVNGQPNLPGCQYPVSGQPCGEARFWPRMPVLVISRFAKAGYVDHTLMNTASLDNWVEWNHKLPALGVWGNRDVNAGSLRSAFIFGD